MASLRSYDLNNTRKAGTDILFFNRVPKVGNDLIQNQIVY